MKLAIFGGTGRTGMHVVEQALEAGDTVKMLARTPSKVTWQDERVTVVEGDLADEAAVQQVVSGTDAVVSASAPHAQGMGYIIQTMKDEGIERLIATSGAGVPRPGDQPTWINKVVSFLLKLLSRDVYEESLKVMEMIEQSGLKWTVARAPRLTDDPAKGDLYTGRLGKEMGMMLTRADFAAFMLRQLEEEKWVQKAPVVTNQ